MIESEALFRGMFNDHSAVMLLIDPTTGQIVKANHAAAQYYGYPKGAERVVLIIREDPTASHGPVDHQDYGLGTVIRLILLDVTELVQVQQLLFLHTNQIETTLKDRNRELTRTVGKLELVSTQRRKAEQALEKQQGHAGRGGGAGQHEPRDSPPHERGNRHDRPDRPAPGHGSDSGTATLRGNHPIQRRKPAFPDQLIESITDIAKQVYAVPADRDEFKKLMEEQGKVVNHECRFRRRDGTEFWVSRTAHAIRDETGAITHYLGFASDITERKKNEELMRILSCVSESESTMVVVTDAERRIEWGNETFWRITGYQPEEITGKILTASSWTFRCR